jgi:hypothetical protein
VKSFIACVLLACVASVASARPIVIDPSATLTNPDPVAYRQFGHMVATNGEYALVLGSRDETTGDEIMHRAALLYRRVNGSWQFQRILQTSARGYDSYTYPSVFAMKGDLAIAELDGATSTYRLGSSGWQLTPRTASLTEDIEISGNRIVESHGECSWNATVSEPDAAGNWIYTGLSGPLRDCDDEYWGGPVDIDGDRILIGNGNTRDLEWQEAPIFTRSGPGSWNLYGSIRSPFQREEFTGEVALRGDDAVVDTYYGPYVFRLPNLGQVASRLQAPDVYLQPRLATYWYLRKIEKSGDLVFVRELSYDRVAPVINVYRANATAPGTYEHVAVLKGGAPILNTYDVNNWFDVSGNVVIAGGADEAYIFDLPASLRGAPAARQDDFEAGNAANWRPNAGSQFSVVTSGSNHFYRQASTTGEAHALLSGAYWINQAIEANVTPRAFDGNDRWVGLVTRFRDSQNYFYVTMRSSGSVQLKRLRAGAISTLASATLPVTLNRQYRLRLESIGGTHRVYVDGALLLDADVADAPSAGSAGVIMNRARADFDNVMVTPSPLTTVFTQDFASTSPGGWTLSGSGQWGVADGVYSQNSVAAEARAVIGGPTSDQVVEARIRPIAWSTAGTAEPWAGVLARYVDNSNYYYLHLRRGGTVSLRKLVDGAITTLASATFPVSVNTQYTLRLEAVGTQLRGYVNGNVVLQATDNSLTHGIGGLMTNKAAVRFDDYLAYQP